ncbi:glycosyltransferase family 2 protein [Candidatus Woesearchaeota archaeon]|nr:glycosyltransferase family 2 protein [Candidatus Woesearchaeota archaeon]MBW3005634.1 glycosyltransferase family 2 protein [Candidatus Woesearchaeota archaeon]
MISIIIPAYNESLIIANTIKNLKSFFAKQKTRIEIIVVDDASTDNTSKIAKNAGAKVLRNPKNKRSSYTILRGIKSAKYSKILIVDADNEIPIQNILPVLNFKRGTFIIGQRPYLPRKSERFLAFWTKHLLGINDPLCYLKLFDKRDLKGLNSIHTKERYAFQLIVLAIKNGLKIKNLPVKGVKRRHESKHTSNLRIWIRILKNTLKTFQLYLIKKK